MKNKKKLIIIAFFLLSLVQLSVLFKQIYDNEKTLEVGTKYDFEIAPIDPNDILRGEYLTLNIKEDRIKLEEPIDLEDVEKIYATLEKDGENSFAKVKEISITKPNSTDNDYIILHDFYSSDSVVFFSFPFKKYYIEESMASRIESIYNEYLQDSTKKCSATVYIKDGKAVLSDLLLDGKSVKSFQ